MSIAARNLGPTQSLNPFARMVGDGWRSLDEQVITFYLSPRSITGAGRFHVRRRATPFHRFVGRAVRLPAPGEHVTVRTEQRRSGAEETWTTWFDGLPIVTRKRTDGRHLLEALGPFVFAFRLVPSHGAIDFVHEATYLAWRWRWMIRLPRFVAPRVGARSGGGSQASSLEVAVWVDAPLLGRVLECGGTLWIVDPAEPSEDRA